MRKWVNKVNLSRFSTQNLFQIRAWVISARKAKHLDVTTMFTYSHFNTPLGQSERAYCLSYFIQAIPISMLHKWKNLKLHAGLWLLLTKMPTSGDLKSGDFLFFTTPHPRMSTHPPSPFPNQLPQPDWEWLRTLYEVLHELHTIKIHNHCFNAKKSLLKTRLNMCKNAPENVL